MQRDVSAPASTPAAPEGPTQPPPTVAAATEPAASEPSREPLTGSGAEPAAVGEDPAALEELARRLYDPLCARLRAEFWLDRERSGLVTERRW